MQSVRLGLVRGTTPPSFHINVSAMFIAYGIRDLNLIDFVGRSYVLLAFLLYF